MNWAATIYIVVMAIACYCFYKYGKKNEKLKQSKQFKKDVDEYLENKKKVDVFRGSLGNYSDDDFMSGRPLYDETPKAKEASPEDSKNFTDRR